MVRPFFLLTNDIMIIMLLLKFTVTIGSFKNYPVRGHKLLSWYEVGNLCWYNNFYGRRLFAGEPGDLLLLFLLLLSLLFFIFFFGRDLFAAEQEDLFDDLQVFFA